jgi:poly(A) polymerase
MTFSAEQAASVVDRVGHAFADNGKRIYLVGGTVRDELLGRPTRDVDLTTDARPPEIKRLVGLARPEAVFDVGEKFGTIGAIIAGIKVEITTFRSEKYAPRSRKPEVDFGISLEGDLARRDFTINAIARDALTGKIADPFDGLADLDQRLVRAVGNPDERFTEDPLRLLRAVRLTTELGFDIEPRTEHAIKRDAPALHDISKERVFEELNRILESTTPGRGFRLVTDLGLAKEVLPELVELRATSQGRRMKDVFAHTLAVLDRTPADLVLRWSALLHDIGKPRTFVQDESGVHFPGHEVAGERIARSILNRLRMDQNSIVRVTRLVGLHMRANQYEDSWTDGAVRRLIRESDEDLERLLTLSMADVTSYRQAKVLAAADRVARLRERCGRLEEEENVKAMHSPLDGNDLMQLFGRGPGPWIRPIKDHLLDLVIEGQLAMDDRDAATEIARRLMSDEPTAAREPV